MVFAIASIFHDIEKELLILVVVTVVSTLAAWIGRLLKNLRDRLAFSAYIERCLKVAITQMEENGHTPARMSTAVCNLLEPDIKSALEKAMSQPRPKRRKFVFRYLLWLLRSWVDM